MSALDRDQLENGESDPRETLIFPLNPRPSGCFYGQASPEGQRRVKDVCGVRKDTPTKVKPKNRIRVYVQLTGAHRLATSHQRVHRMRREKR